MSVLILVLIVTGLEIVSSIWNGYVLTVLWGWFVVPTFHLPVLTLAPAIGIALVIGFMTHRPDVKSDETPIGEKIIRASIDAILYPLIALIIAWVVHLFM